MINLIPPQGHKTVRREYLLRVGATLGFLFSSVALALTVALIPTFILVGAQIKTLENERGRIVDDSTTFTEADKEVLETKEMLAQLKTTPTSMLASEVIADIKALAPPSIIFSTFSIDAPNGIIEKIQVQGKAPTREMLAQFKNSLESSPKFEKAEVPIADLAKDTDLPFVVTVIVDQKTISP